MKKIVVGSLNKTKINAVKAVFPDDEINSVGAPSEVLSQPIGNEMTRAGAINRARYSLKESHSHYGIGLEGGVVFISGQLYLCNWGALVTNEEQLFTASGAYIPLPKSFKQPILAGDELGELIERYVNKKNIRSHEGAIGIFTNELMMREQMYIHLVTLLKGQLLYVNNHGLI